MEKMVHALSAVTDCLKLFIRWEMGRGCEIFPIYTAMLTSF